jgi:hypothetical protein
MITVKFSHVYSKMPPGAFAVPTKLLQVLTCDASELSLPFIDYDTTYAEGRYALPTGKLIILFLKTNGQLWTTIRRWTPEKINYYKLHVGEDVQIEKTEEK